MTMNHRMQIGVILFVASGVLPLLIPLVALTSWPPWLKGAVGGALAIGGPEVLLVAAAAVMGKENFERIMAKAKGLLRVVKPAGNVGKGRHAVGLCLFLLPVLPTYVMAYVPEWLPDSSPLRLWVNIAADIIFLVSLFVLGGDFWDKLRALFVRRARAVFPE